MLKNLLGKASDFTRDISVKTKESETVSSLPILKVVTFEENPGKF